MTAAKYPSIQMMPEPIFRSIGISRLRMVQDGDGVTTLVAGTGCPLRCRYCLNPHCFTEKGVQGTYTIEELYQAVCLDDLYFRATGGGIVFGGGEPLLQAEFIHAFRNQCPKEWRFTLETSLSVPTDALMTVMEGIDLYLVDCKDMDNDIYRRYTGSDCTMRDACLRLLQQQGLQDRTIIRVPLIPGYNTPEDQKRSVAVLQGMGFTRFDLFTYDTHRGQEKMNTGK